MKNRVFVTGGTGFLGSYLIRFLVHQGKEVYALRRKSSSLELLGNYAAKVNWIEGNILDSHILEDSIQKVNQVYHCAGFVSFNDKKQDLLYKINTEGTANIVNAALAYNKRLLHVSSIAALGRSAHQTIIDEDSPWQASRYQSAYSKSKSAGEREVWRGIAEGLDAVIVNPSVIIGGGYWETGTGQLFKRVKDGLRFYPSGSTGFVDVRDVVQVMYQLMEMEISGERYIINAENLDYLAFFSAIAKELDISPPSKMVKGWMGELAWRFENIRSLLARRDPIITRNSFYSLCQSYQFKNDKIKDLLGYSFIPIEQTIKETASLLTQGNSFGVLNFNFQEA